MLYDGQMFYSSPSLGLVGTKSLISCAWTDGSVPERIFVFFLFLYRLKAHWLSGTAARRNMKAGNTLVLSHFTLTAVFLVVFVSLPQCVSTDFNHVLDGISLY